MILDSITILASIVVVDSIMVIESIMVVESIMVTDCADRCADRLQRPKSCCKVVTSGRIAV